MPILPKKFARIRLTEEDMQNKNLDLNLFNWSDRESYLAWRTEWKNELKEKIIEIRRLKSIRRDTSQSEQVRGDANSERQMMRIECYNLLLIRKWGKVEAAAQRQMRLQKEAGLSR